MGKPTSCFSIITCGGDLKDHGDIDVSENKATSEKRGWSFRKRSTRQRVLSNSVVAEAPPPEYKDSFEAAGLDSKQTETLKIVTDCINEKPQLSCPENANTIGVEDNDDDQVEESIAIVIQTAIRGLLAQMALTKLKSVVKLQAAVRGHLVRRHAVGSLQCIQAIVKIQALVRGHSSLQSDRKNEHDLNRYKIREDKEFDKSKGMSVSIEKLLSNKFAKLLLDSTPKTTSINIKCDPLKSDSAWKWLERWMSASSVDTVEQSKAEIISEKAGNGNVECIVSELDNGIDSEVIDSDNGILVQKKLPSPTEGEAGLISCEDQSSEVQACEATSRETKEMKNTSMEAETGKSSSSREMEEAKDMSMEAATDESSHYDYNPDTKSRELTVSLTKELDNSENFSLPGSKEMVAGGSECGPELSISSTLDSPDRCDSGTFELEHDHNVLVEHIPDSNRSETEDVGEVDVTPVMSSSNMSQPTLNDSKKSDLLICESIVSGDISDSRKIEVDSETGNQACRLSPEASPKSHVTVLESQGTPSSQLSVKANKNKASNSGSANKKSHFNNTHNSAKDQKNGKRRNSSGSARPDDVELESRDSTSNNSLPHFMQATESARAKLNSNNSPRSSPDIQDRDINGKKRLSLSGSNGRQGSPRIQRSMSQAQQTAKGNESKWKR